MFLHFYPIFFDTNIMHRLIDKYKRRLAKDQLSPNTIKSYLTSVYTFLNIYKKVNGDNILAFQKYLEMNYSPKSVNLRIIAFNRFLSFIGKPELRLKLLKCRQSSYLDNVISFDDYLLLKECLSKERDKKKYFIVWVLASTGVRISELIQFRVQDFRRGYLDVHAKGNKIRRVFIPKSLQFEILQWLDTEGINNGPAFVGKNGRALSIRGITKGLERAAEKYKIDRHMIHPHAFRHLFAKKFLEKNGDISLLADLLGHESLDTTKIYLRRSSQEQKTIIDDLVQW